MSKKLKKEKNSLTSFTMSTYKIIYVEHYTIGMIHQDRYSLEYFKKAILNYGTTVPVRYGILSAR